jgi:hypothetical protein
MARAVRRRSSRSRAPRCRGSARASLTSRQQLTTLVPDGWSPRRSRRRRRGVAGISWARSARMRIEGCSAGFSRAHARGGRPGRAPAAWLGQPRQTSGGASVRRRSSKGLGDGRVQPAVLARSVAARTGPRGSGAPRSRPTSEAGSPRCPLRCLGGVPVLDDSSDLSTVLAGVLSVATGIYRQRLRRSATSRGRSSACPLGRLTSPPSGSPGDHLGGARRAAKWCAMPALRGADVQRAVVACTQPLDSVSR